MWLYKLANLQLMRYLKVILGGEFNRSGDCLWNSKIEHQGNPADQFKPDYYPLKRNVRTSGPTVESYSPRSASEVSAQEMKNYGANIFEVLIIDTC